MTFSALTAAPLFALGYCDRVVPSNTPNLRHVKSWRPSSPVYRNEACDRCDGRKCLVTETLWCEDCLALPACDECGMPEVDGCDDFCGCPPPRWIRGYDAPYTP
jgi:hypothetical protein